MDDATFERIKRQHVKKVMPLLLSLALAWLVLGLLAVPIVYYIISQFVK
jgi:hypothetical protein